MLRNSYSISPHHMSGMTTPSFHTLVGNGPIKGAASSSPSASRKKAPSPLNFSPPEKDGNSHVPSPISDKSKSWHAGNGSGQHHNVNVDVQDLIHFGTGEDGDEEKKSEDQSSSNSGLKESSNKSNMPSAKFSSEASLELLVLHKSEGKSDNVEKGGESKRKEEKEVGRIVGGGGEDDAVGLSLENSINEITLDA